MRLKFKINTLIIIFLVSISLYFNDVMSEKNIKIIKKINNEIITNLDVNKEYSYLISLNNNLKELPLNQAYKIAEDSIVRETIKIIELKKVFDFDKINQEEVKRKITFNLINNLKLKNEQDLKNYFNNYDLTLSEVQEKLKIEILWNQLIQMKYKDQINIDEEYIKKKVELEISKNEITEYDLSEIVFQVNNKKELDEKKRKIEENIISIGFSNTATKFSISDTAKLGGKIGKIKESELSELILKKLDSLNINQFTDPINVGGSFIILFINDKKFIKLQSNKNEIFKKIINNEKKLQFENFSRIHFNKIKINSVINEL